MNRPRTQGMACGVRPLQVLWVDEVQVPDTCLSEQARDGRPQRSAPDEHHSGWQQVNQFVILVAPVNPAGVGSIDRAANN